MTANTEFSLCIFMFCPLKLPAGALSLKCHLPEVIHPQEHALRLRRNHLNETYHLNEICHLSKIYLPIMLQDRMGEES